MMNDDMELVREYATRQSDQAFEALVSRHVSLVHSAALRQVRDPHLAEEITQTVFTILARKAGSLSPKTILPGWLYRTTRYVSAAALKIRRRREHREQEAHMQGMIQEAQTNSAWAQLAPLLDEAMSQLRDKDRDAIVLRYFQNKGLRDVGAVLGVDEYAAQKRVMRALERLRAIFAEYGAVSTATIIAAAISSNSVEAAPAVLAKTATAVALAKGAVASGSTATLIKGGLKLMAWTKTKTATVTGAILLLVGAATTIAIVKGPMPKPSAPRQNGSLTADRSTPKGALLVMSQAMEAGDAKEYVECFAFTTADELKLKATLEGIVAANARFKKALSDKFGVDAAKGVFSNLPFVIPADVINSATEKIEGDSAGVTISGGKGGRPIQFTKINSDWKMAADGFWHLNPAVMNDMLGRAIKALDETAAEISYDKFKAPMEAVDKMKERAR